MRILFVSNARLPTEKAHGLQIMKTCESLARAGHTVELVAPKRNNPLKDEPFSYYGIKTRFPVRRLFTLDLIHWGRIGFLIQEFTFALASALAVSPSKYDMVYSRDEMLLWLLSLFGFRPIVWESHVGGWNFFARYAARHSKVLTVISGGLKDFYVEKGIPAEKIVVIPSAIDLEEFAHPESKEDARQRLGLPLDKKIALYAGRLDGWKGTDTLLQTAEFLPEGVRVAIVGGEPHQVAQLQKKYPKVLFLGFRPYNELANNQSAADVLVVPNTGKDTISARFTSPLKVVAHMTAGRPIVASDLPSIRELTGDDGALLVPADDPRALAEGIEKVLSDAVLAESLSKRAKERVAKYTWTWRAETIGNLFSSH